MRPAEYKWGRHILQGVTKLILGKMEQATLLYGTHSTSRSMTRPHKYTSMSQTLLLTCMDQSPQWLYYLQGSVHTMVILPAVITPLNGYITCSDHSPQWLYYLQGSLPTMVILPLQGSFPIMVILPAGISPHNGYITCRDHSP